MLLKLLNKLVN